jgi:hypothetical protein
VESHPKPPAAIGGNGSIEEFLPSYARDPSGKLGKLLSPIFDYSASMAFWYLSW